MSPPFVIPNPEKSFVQIPGSGQDKSLIPVCLNVAQINSCARTLRTIMNFNSDAPPDENSRGSLANSPFNSEYSPNENSRGNSPTSPISPISPLVSTLRPSGSTGNTNQNPTRSSGDEGLLPSRLQCTDVQPRNNQDVVFFTSD